MFQMPKIIRSPESAQESSRKVMDGIIKSTLLTPYQRGAIDGIIRSGLPDEKRKNKPILHAVPESATKVTPGYQGFQGRSF